MQNFDPTKMSHLKRLHGKRRQAMVDLFMNENEEWRAKWLEKLGLDPDPAPLKVRSQHQQPELCYALTFQQVPEGQVTTGSINADLPELPPEIIHDASHDKSASVSSIRRVFLLPHYISDPCAGRGR